MPFKIELTREERWALITCILDQEFNLFDEINGVKDIDADWARDIHKSLTNKRNQLRALAIKIEG